MTGDSGLHPALLRALADEPLLVEARGVLLGLPGAQALHGSTGAGGLVFTAERGMAIGFGHPSEDFADLLREVADDAGMVQEPVDVHLPLEAAARWLERDDVRVTVQHRVQTLVEPMSAEGSAGSLAHETDVIEDRGDPRLETLPRALRHEFAALDPWPVVAVSLAGGAIAAIASAFVETESWFDVSIDTVPDFRRSGFGAACAKALIQHQARRGKDPVWMVRENNRPSLALSARLGFRDVGRVQGLMLR